jgi:hypothetical protein
MKWIVTALALSLAMNSAFAAKGGKNQDGNGGDGGGNDTPDPDYLISAVNSYYASDEPGLFTADGECQAFNPDLKGPGVAYLAFFPAGCTVTTSLGVVLDRVSIKPIQDEFGFLVGVEFRGILDGDNYSGYSDLMLDSQIVPPADDLNPDNDSEHFDLVVQSSFLIEGCTKIKGKQTCQNLGYVWLDTLHYHFVSF